MNINNIDDKEIRRSLRIICNAIKQCRRSIREDECIKTVTEYTINLNLDSIERELEDIAKFIEDI